MMAESRNKPKFLRNDWHKKIKLGRGVKNNRKWRAGRGIQSKVRLNRKGHPDRPRIGWGADNSVKNKVAGLEAVRVENLSGLKNMKSSQGIIIANVGMRKRKEIIKAANEKKIKILNRYKEKK
jgi:large subunit ribosomal protein L32e